MTDTLSDLTQALLEAARAAGADAADALAKRGTSLAVDVRDGGLEQAERSEGTDIGLRVLVGQKQANVSSSDTRPETLVTMAERAVAMAREAPDDANIGLADPAELVRQWDVTPLELCDPTAEPAPDALMADAMAAEAAATAVAGITQVEAASAAYGATEVHLAASNGFAGGYTRTSRSISCSAIAGTGTGMERDFDGDMRIFQSDLRSPEEIGQTAATRATERLGARRPKTGTFPVLFDERISSSLINHLLFAINGSSIARGSSWAQDLLERPVLPDSISLVEDPHLPRKTGSRPFDAEGLQTARRVIIDKGILTGWTLDLATARKLGMRSTANAARGTSGPPSPATWNTELTAGSRTKAELLREMGTGLLVTSMIGATINPTTGDYSRGASGIWIENGEPAYPVNECTIADNLRDMLRRIVPANDARSYLSRVVPSLLIEGMAIAGD